MIRFEIQAPPFLNLWLIPKAPWREKRWERSILCTRRRKFVHMLDVITFEPRKELGANFGIIMLGMCVECFHCVFMSAIPCSKCGNVNKLGCWQLQWPLRFAYCLPSHAACQHHVLNNFVVWGNWDVKSCTRVAVWMCYGMKSLDLKSKDLHFSTSDSSSPPLPQEALRAQQSVHEEKKICSHAWRHNFRTKEGTGWKL